MNDALIIFYQIFARTLNFVFNDMLIVQGVSVGWVLISCLIFGVLIKSILNLPRSAPTERGIRSSHMYSLKQKAYNNRGIK